jgi:hypothetical protein
MNSSTDSIKLSSSTLPREASLQSNPKPKRKSPQAAIELRQVVRELCKSHTSTKKICEITNRTKQAVYAMQQRLIENGELLPSEASYIKCGPPECRKWYKVVERVAIELDFYKAQGLVPTLRKMYYRLVELGVLVKSKSNYDRLSRVTAAARKGIDSTYSTKSCYPKLPIDCFVDEKRILMGHLPALIPPRQPEPADWPDDWDEYQQSRFDEAREEIDELRTIEDVLNELDDIPNNYNGSIKEGSNGRNPSKNWKQPIYREIWTESATVQPDIDKWFGDQVYVAAGGFISTPYFSKNCKRLAGIVRDNDHIEKIVILYLQDYDKSGNDIADNLKKGFEYYCGKLEITPDDPDYIIDVEVEFRPIAITSEQVKKYKLIENPDKKHNVQLEAFITTEKKIEIFKKIIQDELDDCWDKSIYEENCPPEEYDYEANNEEEPEDYDIDTDNLQKSERWRTLVK